MTADTPLPRAGTRTVSARTFQAVAIATLALLWLVVTTGGLVRLTSSGLGCPHWPTCDANQLTPPGSYHALIEFSNRAISGIAMVAAVVTAVLAYRVRGLPRSAATGALVAAAGTVAQVPLGAVTVAFNLNPWLVMSHFLLAMVVVVVSTWVTVAAWRLAHGGAPVAIGNRRAGLAAWTSVSAVVLLVTTGAAVTAAGPHPGSTAHPIERLGNFYWATWVHVRAATVFTVLFVGLTVWLWRRARDTAARRLATIAVVLTVCQAAVGEYQYRNGLPWQVIAVHVAIAATLVVTVVAVASLVWDEA